MKMGSVQANAKTGLLKVWKADSSWERGRGLLGRPALDWNEGFWLEPCASVHTMFMRYPLDLVFLDSEGVIRKIACDVRPWRMASAWGAQVTLEMRSGQVDRTDWKVGDKLAWKDAA